MKRSKVTFSIFFIICAFCNSSFAQLYIPNPGPSLIQGKKVGLNTNVPVASLHLLLKQVPNIGGPLGYDPAIRLEYKGQFGSSYWDLRGEEGNLAFYFKANKIAQFSSNNSNLNSHTFSLSNKVGMANNNASNHTYGIGIGAMPIGNTSSTAWSFNQTSGGAVLSADVNGNLKILTHSGGGVLPHTTLDNKVKLLVDVNGNIGVGTLSPSEKLEIRGDALFVGKTDFNAGQEAAYIYIGDHNHYIKSVFGKGVYLSSFGNNAKDALYLQEGTGNIGIGVANPKQKLVVNGMICGTEVRVALNGSPCWADHVFSEDYDLLPIKHLEEFINKNKHLPGIPTEEDVRESGVELGKMAASLLEKIEELTLYLIDQNKLIDQLSKEIMELKNK